MILNLILDLCLDLCLDTSTRLGHHRRSGALGQDGGAEHQSLEVVILIPDGDDSLGRRGAVTHHQLLRLTGLDRTVDGLHHLGGGGADLAGVGIGAQGTQQLSGTSVDGLMSFLEADAAAGVCQEPLGLLAQQLAANDGLDEHAEGVSAQGNEILTTVLGVALLGNQVAVERDGDELQVMAVHQMRNVGHGLAQHILTDGLAQLLVLGRGLQGQGEADPLLALVGEGVLRPLALQPSRGHLVDDHAIRVDMSRDPVAQRGFVVPIDMPLSRVQADGTVEELCRRHSVDFHLLHAQDAGADGDAGHTHRSGGSMGGHQTVAGSLQHIRREGRGLAQELPVKHHPATCGRNAGHQVDGELHRRLDPQGLDGLEGLDVVHIDSLGIRHPRIQLMSGCGAHLSRVGLGLRPHPGIQAFCRTLFSFLHGHPLCAVCR